MPVLKFWLQNTKVILDQYRLEDITSDSRTNLLDKNSFQKEEFKVEDGIYMVVNDLFFKMSKILNKEKTPISAMLLTTENSNIIIVPSRSYVFLNGRSIEPKEYKII